MKLFLILYTANGIGGTWGPLPYDFNECLNRRADMQEEIKSKLSSLKAADAVSVENWRFACEWHVTRPLLTEK